MTQPVGLGYGIFAPSVLVSQRHGNLDPTWKPVEYRYERLGCETTFRFPCCKLLEGDKISNFRFQI